MKQLSPFCGYGQLGTGINIFCVLGMVAPVSNYGMLGMKRAEIRPGIRSIFLCKDEFGKLGIRIKSICKVTQDVAH